MTPKDDTPSSNKANWLSQFVTSHLWPTASLLQTFASTVANASDRSDKHVPPRIFYFINDFIDPGNVEVAQNESGSVPLVMNSARLMYA